MWSDTIILDYNVYTVGFLKILNYIVLYQKKEKHFLQEMSPHLSQLNVAMAHRSYFTKNLGEIICKSSNWQHLQRLKITILGANWQLFRFERIAKCSYYILSTQNIKFYWFVMKIEKFHKFFFLSVAFSLQTTVLKQPQTSKESLPMADWGFKKWSLHIC